MAAICGPMPAWHGRTDRPFHWGRSCVDERIGCSSHKYADAKPRLPRVAWPVTPFYRCGRRGGQGELLKPPTYAGIAIELTPPTPKVRRTIVTTESGSRPRRREHLVSCHRRISRARPCGEYPPLRVVPARRHIGEADRYHLNKSAVATTVIILASSHFQPHTQRRPT